MNRALVERAGVRSIAIPAWTVNEPDGLLALLDAGVTNVITDDPGLLRARLQEIRGLNPVERLLLRVRMPCVRGMYRAWMPAGNARIARCRSSR